MFDKLQALALAARARRDVAGALRFFSILPPPRGGAPEPPFDPARAAWAAPVAGALIGAVGAAALGVAALLRLPPFVAAALAVATLALATGALPEDGLADVADGFGGGRSREEKLAIMRDGRVGVFGVAALVFSFLLRVGALAALAGDGFAIAAASLILSGAAGRAGALFPIALLAPARADGAGAGVDRLDVSALTAAGLATVVVAFLAGLAALEVMRALFACVVAAAAGWAASALARRQIGGHTGGVAGAAEQAAEIACLIGLLIGGRAP
jgi:adenosylcobinamide-GDP ribazoletransferase